MIKIKEAIVVEGVYDKIRLGSVVDTLILTTEGFGIFRDKEKVQLLRKLAKETGLIIFTDPDRAGFAIRSYIKQGLDADGVRHAFIPDIYGKERRKQAASKEGKLGVEGADGELIVSALLKSGATVISQKSGSAAARQKEKGAITKADFYADGLTGRGGSAQKRRRLAACLELPQRISANMLLDVVNLLLTPEAYKEMVRRL